MSFWARMWARAPRQLRVTRPGRVIIGLALVIGFAAINTGNNLLFLGWGLVLSGIVLSGVMSEATLRSVRLQATASSVVRVGEDLFLPLRMHNTSGRLPAFAIESAAVLIAPTGEELVARAPYQLRVLPNETRALVGTAAARARGVYRVSALVARTAYPFGFFEKSRRYEIAAPPLVVGPARIDIKAFLPMLLAQLGEESASRPGSGDEFYGLRPYRSLDDARRVHWRRSLATGRWVVREFAAAAGRELTVELRLAPLAEAGETLCERTIATACSLAEELLLRGARVAFEGPGIRLGADSGQGQIDRIVQALARLEPGDAPHARNTSLARGRVVVAMAGARTGGADAVLRVSPSGPELSASAA